MDGAAKIASPSVSSVLLPERRLTGRLGGVGMHQAPFQPAGRSALHGPMFCPGALADHDQSTRPERLLLAYAIRPRQRSARVGASVWVQHIPLAVEVREQERERLWRIKCQTIPKCAQGPTPANALLDSGARRGCGTPDL